MYLTAKKNITFFTVNEIDNRKEITDPMKGKRNHKSDFI